ncbi:MAG: class IV adenylate cyclase [Candidatus Aminicenantes bacterium]|nr:class IV adenylate cyclase [Candidatus Aminicenantes bacterium]
MLETEIKFEIDDPEAFKEKILRAGAILRKERYREENILYDFRTRELTRKAQALRLRLVGAKAFLTFKGSPQKSRRFKIREEFETEVKNWSHLRKILKKLGLIPTFRYAKYRTVFLKGKLKICLDETPIGNFCELEGDRPEIVRFARSLGITNRDFIKLDYIQLFQLAERGEFKPRFAQLGKKEKIKGLYFQNYSSSESLSEDSNSSSSSSSSS